MQTFLFTDIEGSTRLWERHPEAMQAALAHHDALLRAAVAAHQGTIFKTVGDAFYAVFPTAPAAFAAALTAQQALVTAPWPELEALRVRIALHAGPAEERDGDFFGPTLNRVARLLGAGHGGQILLSAAVRTLLPDPLPPGVALRDLGERHLKDLSTPERIFQVLAPGLPGAFPPLRTLDARATNLLAQPTALIGRAAEVATLTALLRQPAVRLVTLTGPGGTGKTRLSLQVAAELLDEFADGVFFVGLAALRDPALMPSAIAQALGLKETPGAPLAQQVEEFLAERQLLLVLDNLEQLLAGAPLVATLLGAASGLRVLATSQAPLQLRGEHEVPIQPLALPAEGTLPLDELAAVPAVQLFVERAAGSRPGFALTAENAAAVAEICRRLDGLPLALELAAARSKVLSPQALLPRLQQRLKLLTSGAQDLPTRHQTLRGTIAWSYELLAPAEQALFGLLGVFVGGCTLEALEVVHEAEDALDLVESLVSKSLVRQQEGLAGEPRFLMLETIREYALERLGERPDAAELQGRHARYYWGLAEQAAPELLGIGQQAWLAQLDLEHNNLRAALEWLLAHNPAGALATTAALWRFWYLRGHLSEGRRWLALALAGDATLPAAEAEALAGAGWLADSQGEYDEAERCYARSLTLWRELGDQRGLAHVLFQQGRVARSRGSFDQAVARYREGLALAELCQDRWLIANCLHGLGWILGQQDRHDEALRALQQSLSLSRAVGDQERIAAVLTSLGGMLFLTGDYVQAQHYLEQSRALAAGIGDQVGVATSLSNLALVLQRLGQSEEADRYLAESLQISRQLNDKIGVVICLCNLADNALDAGRYQQARERYREALALASTSGARLAVTTTVTGLACAAVALGQPTEAVVLFAAVDQLNQVYSATRDPTDVARYDTYLAQARAQLAPLEFEQAWEQGLSLDLQQATALALRG